MNTLLVSKLIIGLSFFFSAIFAYAGGVSDGGGNAVVCRDVNQKITSATLLDLYEAKAIYKLPLMLVDFQKDYMQIAYDVALRMDQGGSARDVTYASFVTVDGEKMEGSQSFGIMPHHGNNSIQSQIGTVGSGFNLISGAGLEPVDDFHTIIKPNNCQIEQTALYLDASTEVHVVEEIWNAFDEVNKAALFVHEALYRQMRQAGEENSDRVRRTVGLAFAGSEFKNVLEGVPEDVTICGTAEGAPKYRFAVYEATPGTTIFQFFWLNNKIMLSKTTVKTGSSMSPLTKMEGSSVSTTGVFVLNESLVDRKVSIALKKSLPRHEGEIELSIGQVINTVNEDDLVTVYCNQTSFHCNENRCSSSINPRSGFGF